MTTKQPATPLPWCTMPAQHGGKLMRGFDCTDVARLGLDINHGERAIEQNAAYIAHACNAYPELVAALRQQCARWEELEKLHSGSDGWKPAEARALLRELGEDA